MVSKVRAKWTKTITKYSPNSSIYLWLYWPYMFWIHSTMTVSNKRPWLKLCWNLLTTIYVSKNIKYFAEITGTWNRMIVFQCLFVTFGESGIIISGSANFPWLMEIFCKSANDDHTINDLRFSGKKKYFFHQYNYFEK